MALRRTRPTAGRHADGSASATATADDMSEASERFGDEAWTRLGDLLVARTKVTSPQIGRASCRERV